MFCAARGCFLCITTAFFLTGGKKKKKKEVLTFCKTQTNCQISNNSPPSPPFFFFFAFICTSFPVQTLAFPRAHVSPGELKPCRKTPLWARSDPKRTKTTPKNRDLHQSGSRGEVGSAAWGSKTRASAGWGLHRARGSWAKYPAEPKTVGFSPKM